MKNLFVNFIAIILLSLALTACGENVTGYLEETNERFADLSPNAGDRIRRKCIAADDFGYPKFNVYAKPHAATDIIGSNENQVVPWEESGYEVSASQLLISTTGRWTSWFGNQGSGSTSGSGISSNGGGMVPYASICNLERDTSANACPRSRLADGSLVGGGASVFMLANNSRFNAPCWFTYGYAGYLLFADPDADPNGGSPPDRTLLRSPIAPTLHLYGDNFDPLTGQSRYGDTLLDVPYGTDVARRVGGVDYDGSIIWSRIVDRFYDDNAGDYVVKIKSGARIPGDGPIAYVINTVTRLLLDSAESMYSNLVSNPDFQSVLYSFLVLFVIISAISYIYGFAKISQADLVMRLIKIAVITQLLSPGSWEWFNGFLFTPFIRGTDELICIVMNAAIPGICYGGKGVQVFDSLLFMFISPETHAKIASALFYGSGAGIVYFIMIYVAIIVFLLMLVQTLFAYLIAYIPIAILIILSPIFLSFILFKRTKFLFDGWLKEMFSYSMQSLLAMALLGLVAAIILEFMHRTLGYRVCWKCFWCPVWNIFAQDLVFFGGNWYDPDGMKAYQMDLRYTTASLAVTEAEFLADPFGMESLYPGHMGYLYMDADKTRPGLELVFRNPIDLPYLDPVTDAREIQRRLHGKLMSFSTILAFVILVYVAYTYAHQVGGVAQEIAGSMRGVNVVGMSFGTAGKMDGAAFSALKSAGNVVNTAAIRPLLNAGGGARKAAMRGMYGSGSRYASDSNYNNAMKSANKNGDVGAYNKAHDGLVSKHIGDLASGIYRGDSVNQRSGLDNVFGSSGPTMYNKGAFKNKMTKLFDDYRDPSKSQFVTDAMRQMTPAQLKAEHGASSLDGYLQNKRKADTGKIVDQITGDVEGHYNKGMNGAQKGQFKLDVEDMLKDENAFSYRKGPGSARTPDAGDQGQQGQPAYDAQDAEARGGANNPPRFGSDNDLEPGMDSDGPDGNAELEGGKGADFGDALNAEDGRGPEAQQERERVAQRRQAEERLQQQRQALTQQVDQANSQLQAFDARVRALEAALETQGAGQGLTAQLNQARADRDVMRGELGALQGRLTGLGEG